MLKLAVVREIDELVGLETNFRLMLPNAPASKCKPMRAQTPAAFPALRQRRRQRGKALLSHRVSFAAPSVRDSVAASVFLNEISFACPGLLLALALAAPWLRRLISCE